MTDAPLHPRRVEATLLWLRRGVGGDIRDQHGIAQEHYETLVSALKLIRKGQRATGLTPVVADVGTHVLGLLDYVKKGLPLR